MHSAEHLMEVVRVESRRNGKVYVLFDTGESCMLYAREAAQAGFAEHAPVSAEAWQAVCREILLPRAKKRVLCLLERMDRTEYQLRQKLAQDGCPQEIADEAIRYAAGYHYIDDMRYACAYIRTHEKTKSRRQMQETLRSRGVRGEVIETALEETCTDASGELIRRLLEKKHYDPAGMDRKETQKIFQSLMRKGFSAEEIRAAMRAYENPEEELFVRD